MNPVNKLLRNMDFPVLSDDFFPSLYNEDRPVDTPFKYSVCLPTTPILHSDVFEVLCSCLVSAGVKKTGRLSFEDSVRALDPSTSPGYPLVLLYHNKKQVFADPYAMLLLRDIYEQEYIGGFYSSFPKGDEFLSYKRKKRVRQICGAPLDIAINFVSISLSFNHQLEKCFDLLPLMLGISPSAGGWDAFVDKQQRGSCEMSLDASNFDSSVSAELLQFCCRIRMFFLDQRWHSLLVKSYNHLMGKNMVDWDGFVFVTHAGMASGHVSTAHDNSIISWALFVSFIFDSGISDRLDDYIISVYGDDIHVVYRRDAKYPRYEVEQVKSYFGCKGFILKTDGWVEPYCADFLSRVTKFQDGRAFPVTTRPEKIFAAISYIERKHAPFPGVILQRLNQLRILLYGTDYFDKASLLISNYIEANRGCLDPDWPDAVKTFWTKSRIFRFLTER